MIARESSRAQFTRECERPLYKGKLWKRNRRNETKVHLPLLRALFFRKRDGEREREKEREAPHCDVFE